MILKKQLEIVKDFYREYRRIYDRYLGGEESIYALERLSELLIQSILDLATIMSSKERGAKPSTYRELARYLSIKLGLDSSDKTFLEGLAGFRNILVHGYARIDRGLEEEAFREIYEKIPGIIEKLEENIEDDPCLEEIVDKVKKVAEKLGCVEYILVFGSIARNGCGRDVDLAVKGDFRSALDIGRLIVELEYELGVESSRIDVVDIDHAPPGLLKKILDEAVIVYGEHEKVLEDISRKYRELLRILDEARAIEKKIKWYRELYNRDK